MTFLDMLRDAAARNQSMLCVGLDPEPTRFPAGMQGDVRKIYDFCAAIVDPLPTWCVPSSRRLPTLPRTVPRTSLSA